MIYCGGAWEDDLEVADAALDAEDGGRLWRYDSDCNGRSVPVNSLTLEKLIGSVWYSAAAVTRDPGYCPPYRLIDAVRKMICFYRANLQ